MARLLMVGEVEDARAWEERFRSHRELFSTIYNPMGMNAIHFTTTEDNRFAMLLRVGRCGRMVPSPGVSGDSSGHGRGRCEAGYGPDPCNSTRSSTF